MCACMSKYIRKLIISSVAISVCVCLMFIVKYNNLLKELSMKGRE